MRRVLVVLALVCASCAHHAAIVRATPTPTTTATPTHSLAPSRAPSAAPSAIVVPGAGSSGQAIVVRTPSWNATVGTLEAYEKVGGAWHVFVAPTTAHVGYDGFARDKHEGDGRTPAGVYGFSMAFGTNADPGTHLHYRSATEGDVWVDDPSSSLYNTWQTDPSNGRWRSAERLYQPAPYAYAAVIAYNTARTPGRGSAIFMHVSLGRATSGCVSVDRSVLLRLLRWLDPAQHPVIVMGPSSYVNVL
jgi:L,D-peptidoglycan transpeptidase YkuD (ErfK/YbiS/YcfS/YnhG family)